jgi:predicted permease
LVCTVLSPLPRSVYSPEVKEINSGSDRIHRTELNSSTASASGDCTLVKLLVQPFIAWGLVMLLGLHGSIAITAILMIALAAGFFGGLTKLNRGDAALMTWFTVLKLKR